MNRAWKVSVMRRPWCACFLGLLLAATSTHLASAGEYGFVYVDAFQSGYDLKECYLFDINDHGRACGFATDLTMHPSYSGFHWSVEADKTRIPFTLARGINDAGKIAGLNRVFDTNTGALATIPKVPGAVADPVALDINDHDIVVGYAETCFCSNSSRTLQIPFIWDPVGGSRSIAVPGAKELVKVNRVDVAVGNVRSGTRDGFVYEIASGRTLMLASYFPATPYPWTEATDINDHGIVTGRHRSDDAQSFHGFVWSEAAGARLLPHLNGNPALDVWPWAVNDAGQVVGMAEVSEGVWHAFIWDIERGIRDLNAIVTTPGAFVLDRALEINDMGWIVGDGHFGPAWSSSQAFVLIPQSALSVPVPMNVGLLQLHPNPSRGPATIEYGPLPGRPVLIRVFDIRGRRIASLSGSDRQDVARMAHWDGRDEAGRLVPPGAYLIQVTTAEAVATRRLAIVR